MTDHDTTLEHRPVRMRVTDTRGWSWDRSGDVYSASGPCPRCHAPDQYGQTYRQGPVGGRGDGGGDGAADGVDAADAEDHADDRPDLDVEVDVECRCGPDHEEGTTGCGARWVVRVGDIR